MTDLKTGAGKSKKKKNWSRKYIRTFIVPEHFVVPESKKVLKEKRQNYVKGTQ